MLDFVENAATSSHQENIKEVRLAKLYFRFLLEKIAQKSDVDGLTKYVNSRIKLEKRASANYFDLFSKLRNELPLDIEHSNSFFQAQKNYPIQLEVFGNEFTSAYFKVLSDRLADDIFRLLAVDLINPLVLDAIQYSLNLFKSGKIFREAKSQLKYIHEISEHKKQLENAIEKFKKKKY